MTTDQIVDRVAEITGIPAETIRGRRRCEEVAEAKFLVAWAFRKIRPAWSAQRITRASGSTHEGHGTMRHRIIQADWKYATDTDFRRLADALFEPCLK